MVYFISGHRNLTEEEFERFYKPKLSHILHTDPDPNFLIGDCEGADYMAQDYLQSNGFGDRVVVHHMGAHPRHYVSGLRTVGGYTCDEERDSYMTANSDFDIAYSRKIGSGTYQNVMRRIRMSSSPNLLEKLCYLLLCKKTRL